MKAIVHYQALPISDSAALQDAELPEPELGEWDLLVQVEAVSVNPADYRVRQRKCDDGVAAVLGWDVAGTVLASAPAAASLFRPGDAVYYAGDLQRPGGNSERHAVDARLVARRPRRLSAAEAAALPLSALTAWEALFEHMGFAPGVSAQGRTLLLIGAAGGVGSVAIQLARQVPDLHVIASASRVESQAWCRAMGAHRVIEHAALDELPKETVDAVLMMATPERYFDVACELIVPRGVLCCIVPFASPPDVNRLMQKSASLRWEFMFTRAMFASADMARQGQILARLTQLVDRGALRSTMSELLEPICAAQLRLAHERLERGQMLGKLVLAGFPEDST